LGTLIIALGCAESLPQVERLRDRGLGVIGEIRGALERDEPVAAVALVECGAQLAGRPAHLVEREREKQLLQIALPGVGHLAELTVVQVGEPVLALAKLVGFEVAPVTLKSRISPAKSPL
jgi:hypothetical protein